MSDLQNGNLNDQPELQISGGGAAAIVVAEDEGKRRRRMVILTVLFGMVLLAALLDIAYLLTKRPLTELVPPAAVLTKALPPAFVASFYGASAPIGVAVSPDGQRIFVSEQAGDRLVRAYDRTGRELFTLAQPHGGPARQPLYIAVSPAGQLYVVDRASMRISIFGMDGRFISDLTPPEEAGITSPLGVAFDRSGNLLITDTSAGEHKLVVLDRDGKLVRRVGKSGEGQGDLMFPQQAAVDSRGRAYVTNGNLSRVDVLGADGGYLGSLSTLAGSKAIGMPRGIAIDSLDRLFAVDSVGCVVQVFDVSGDKPSFLYSLGEEGDGNGQFSYPQGIAVDATGRVYVADRVNYRVQVWNY